MITLAAHLDKHAYAERDGWEACDCGWSEEQEFRQHDFDPIVRSHSAHIAEAWREARTIRTRETLAILPIRSVIRDAYGVALEKDEHGWWGAGDDFWSKPAIPALVLWSPEDGAA